MSEADAKLMRVYHALEEEGRLAELTQIGQMISQLDYMEKETKKSDRVHGLGHSTWGFSGARPGLRHAQAERAGPGSTSSGSSFFAYLRMRKCTD